MAPKVKAARARFSAFSCCGSPPRCAFARISFARRRASSGSRVSTVPIVTRRCCRPMRYWTIQVRFPPALTRTPKQGRVSSKTICSDLPEGRVRLLMLGRVSRIRAILGSIWEATSRFPAIAFDHLRQKVLANFLSQQAVLMLPNHLCTGGTASLNQRVQGSNPCTPTNKFKDLAPQLPSQVDAYVTPEVTDRPGKNCSRW